MFNLQIKIMRATVLYLPFLLWFIWFFYFLLNCYATSPPIHTKFKGIVCDMRDRRLHNIPRLHSVQIGLQAAKRRRSEIWSFKVKNQNY